jgi:mannose-1-phosphate guanylyltransferase
MASGGHQRHRYALIMAGGSGTRFWPQSRRRRPKQFLAVNGHRTLLQETADRLRGLVASSHLYVIAPRELAKLIRTQLPRLPRANLLIEPSARGTAACLALASAHIGRRDPRAVVASFPADHVIAAAAAFRACVRAAFAAAEQAECLVTIGVQPTSAETGFGYIEVAGRRRESKRSGGRRAVGGVPEVRRAIRFVEKPNRRTAERFAASGRHFWNAGMFVWQVSVFAAALRRHAPAIARAVDAVLHGGAARKRAYAALPVASVDTAVMERAKHIVVVKATFDWSDVGSWGAMAALWGTDAQGNATRGAALLIDCHDTLVFGAQRLVAVLGARDLVVVDSDDALLVCPRSRAQEVRRLVEALARDRRYRRLR